MIRTFRFRACLGVFATLALTLLYSPPANTESGSQTTYWVAVLEVSIKCYDKDEFRSHLQDFHKEVSSKTAGRSVWSRMDTNKQCLDSKDREVPHCEVLDIAWKPESRKLTLSIEESDSQVGLVDQHECTTSDSFELCFEHHLEYMAAKVGSHDIMCHMPGRKCKINKNSREFEPSPK